MLELPHAGGHRRPLSVYMAAGAAQAFLSVAN